MSVDRLATPLPLPGSGRVDADRANLERLKARELAQEFESMLLLQMMRQMRQSMTDETEEEKGLSADTMIDLVDGELARQISRQGGLGLAEVMRQAIERQIGNPTQGPSAQTTPAIAGPSTTEAYMSVSRPFAGPLAVDRATVPAAAEVQTPGVGQARLTSNYGWRQDPFTGAARYHNGIDLKASYGQSVPAAGDGRVVEVAERGAYGLTVLIEHQDGLKTRYAHLAAAQVAIGDRVLQGQEIGRVGQSGRATGPHLHFEVIRHGQRIDPTTVVALEGSGLGGLKLAGLGADSTVGRHPETPAMSGVDDED